MFPSCGEMQNLNKLLPTSNQLRPTPSKLPRSPIYNNLQLRIRISHIAPPSRQPRADHSRTLVTQLPSTPSNPPQCKRCSVAASSQATCCSSNSPDVAPQHLRSLGASQLESARRLGLFLRRRRWLRPTPDTPIQLVRLPDDPTQVPALPGAAAPDSHQAVAATATACRAGLTVRHWDAQTGGGCSSSDGNCCCGDQVGGLNDRGSPGIDQRCFYLIRDDLLHPVLGGNKVRKLDALLPALLAEGTTDVMTCGGVQSAHLAAVAVTAAELRLRSHLLVRGEPPKVPAGYHLVTRMYGSQVSYVSRAEYADRQAMLRSRAEGLQRNDPAAKVAVIAEGGGDAAALLGLVRLVHWLAYGNDDVDVGDVPQGSSCSTGRGAAGRQLGSGGGDDGDDGERRMAAGLRSTTGFQRSALSPVTDAGRLPDPATTPYKFVVDSGTGTTAIGVSRRAQYTDTSMVHLYRYFAGLALGIALLGLPWRILAVTLAGDLSYYQSQADQLIGAFLEIYGVELYGDGAGPAAVGSTAPSTQQVDGGPLFVDATTSAGASCRMARGDGAETGAPPTTILDIGGTPLAAPPEADEAAALAGVAAMGAAAEAAATAAAAGGGAGPGADVAAAAAPGSAAAVATGLGLPLSWRSRLVPRRFGKVLEGEIAVCKEVARQYGIGLDPIYSLAAWEVCCTEATATPAAAAASVTAAGDDAASCTAEPVVMLHGGGALGLHGLAQRYPEAF